MFNFDPDILRFFVLTYPVFLFSLSFHELAHAITAKWGGDLTSAYQGRVTMNPIAHIDPIGTVLMPFLMAISSGIPLLGWAKPVPVVSTNFRRGDGYGVIVALAGPFSNLLIAIFSAIVLQVFLITHTLMHDAGMGFSPGTTNIIVTLIGYSIQINLVLMLFNLLPIPPLDGSHVLWHWFVKRRPQWHNAFFTAQQFGFIILIVVIASGALTVLHRFGTLPLARLLIEFGKLPIYFL